MAGRDPQLPPPSYGGHRHFYTPESSARFDAAVQEAIRTGKPYELDLEIVRTDGAIRSVMSRGEVERDGDGQIVLVRGTVQDVTERKQAEAALQRSANEIQDLYNHAPCGYHSIDKDGVVVQINDTELSWLGYQREEVIGKIKFSELLTPESGTNFQDNFSQFKAAGEIRDVEYEMADPQGAAFALHAVKAG